MTTTIDISTMQAIQDLLSLLETDTEVTLTNANAPIITLSIKHHVNTPENGRVPDMYPKIWISDDFDEQLPESFWINRKL